MPATKKKTPEKRKEYVNLAVEGFISRLSTGSLSKTETLLFATLLQTVDNSTLQGSIRDRMADWERRFEDLRRHLETQQALVAATSGTRRQVSVPGPQPPPNLNPMGGNSM